MSWTITTTLDKPYSAAVEAVHPGGVAAEAEQRPKAAFAAFTKKN